MNAQVLITTDIAGIRTLSTLVLPPQYKDGVIFDVTSASLDIYDGSDLVVSGVGDVPSSYARNGISYTFTASVEDELSASAKANYLARWDLNNGQRNINQFFDVVFWKLAQPGTLIDIQNEKPALFRNLAPSAVESATENGTLNNFVSLNLTARTAFYDGSTIEWRSGLNTGAVSIVDEWDFESRSFQLIDDLENEIKKDDSFELTRSFQPELTASWKEIVANMNSWPRVTEETGLSYIVDPFDLTQLHIYKTIVKICSNLRQRTEDPFDMWHKEYIEKVSQADNELRLKLDNNLDGIHEAENDTTAGGGIFLSH